VLSSGALLLEGGRVWPSKPVGRYILIQCIDPVCVSQAGGDAVLSSGALLYIDTVFFFSGGRVGLH